MLGAVVSQRTVLSLLAPPFLWTVALRAYPIIGVLGAANPKDGEKSSTVSSLMDGVLVRLSSEPMRFPPLLDLNGLPTEVLATSPT